MTHSDTRLGTGSVSNIFLVEKWKKCAALIWWQTGNGSGVYLLSKEFINKFHTKLRAKWNVVRHVVQSGAFCRKYASRTNISLNKILTIFSCKLFINILPYRVNG